MSRIFEKIHFIVLKFIIYANVNAKASLYLPLTILLSLATEFYPLPDSYFSYKDNVLNRGFMKLDSFWSVFFLIPFAIVVSYAYSKGNFTDVVINVSRTFFAIYACLIIRTLLANVEIYYYHCNRYALILKSEQECTAQGYKWIEFSLSGHTYFLFYYSLISMEEMRLYRIWQLFANAVSDVEKFQIPFQKIQVFSSFTEQEFNKMKKLMKIWNNIVKLWIVVIGIYIVLLDFCAITTLVYFHELDEKVCGSILAIGTWYIIYKCLYRKIIRKNIQLYDDETWQQKNLMKDWYQFEVENMYYFKKIPCFSPFLQPNFDI